MPTRKMCGGTPPNLYLNQCILIHLTGFFVAMDVLKARNGDFGLLMSPRIKCSKPAKLTLKIQAYMSIGDYGTKIKILTENTYQSGYMDVILDLEAKDIETNVWFEREISLPEGSYSLVIAGKVNVPSLNELAIDDIKVIGQCTSSNNYTNPENASTLSAGL